MKFALHWSVLGVLTILIVALSGCSGNSPVNPSLDNSDLGSIAYLPPLEGDPVQFMAEVATMDQNRRMVTFNGRSDTVIAAHNCEIVRLNNENESPIPFSEIKPGDTMNVYGERQQNGYIVAYQLRIYCGGCMQYDLAFRDTIVAIDYAAGTFTVAGRTETIMIDANTFIWGNVIIRHAGDNSRYQNQGTTTGGAAKENPGYCTSTHDTILVLTDLAPGDVVEVRADIVDEATLLAARIKLANSGYKECIEFNAMLATVDVDGRIVTFDAYTWIGTVCKGARLIGLDGEVLTLVDFAAGEWVAVKGFPVTDDTLRVCQMEKIPTP